VAINHGDIGKASHFAGGSKAAKTGTQNYYTRLLGCLLHGLSLGFTA